VCPDFFDPPPQTPIFQYFLYSDLVAFLSSFTTGLRNWLLRRVVSAFEFFSIPGRPPPSRFSPRCIFARLERFFSGRSRWRATLPRRPHFRIDLLLVLVGWSWGNLPATRVVLCRSSFFLCISFTSPLFFFREYPHQS